MKIYGKYFFRYKVPFLIAILCVVGEAVCDLLGPTIMARVIDEGIAKGLVANVAYWGGLMLLFTGIGAATAIVRSILSSHISQRIGADLRQDLFTKIMNFSEASADRLEGGSLITRMTNDTTQITHFVNGLMRIFLKAPITCIGSIVLASILNLRLSLVIYGVVLAVAVMIILSMKLSYPRFALLQKAMDRVNSVVQEYLIGVRLVKAFGTYEEETERFSQANTTLMKRGISTQIIITLMAPIMTLTVGLGTAMLVFMGSRLFELGQVQPGNISAFTIYMAQILNSLLMITNIFNTFVRTKASTARIKEILEAEEDFPHSGEKVRLGGDVAFENVTFSYPGGSGAPALRNLSFEVKQGESLAVIGPTGSGKSTICWLLLRFYDVSSGAVLLDGRNIKEMNVDTLRENVALVPQNPMLFSGSVADNIRWGKPSATQVEVRLAAQQAQAGFIAEMPSGFDSMLGSAGVNISGGQKQRISIARGMLKDAPVLVLDDATSALDSVTEARVKEELKKMAQTHTVITVTQRCTTALFFDKILVMENGERVGFGSHKELLAGCPVYRDIYHSQVDSTRGTVNG